MENISKKDISCSCCVMDNKDDNLVIESNGKCTRCNEFERRILPNWNYGVGHEDELAKLLEKIKLSGKRKKYDCIIGVSGGLDSTFLLHLAVKKWGLRPYVFHIDCGWNLPIATDNIKKVCKKLKIELHIEQLDWDELREMQLAWFKTGLANLDVPQDHAFISLTDKLARKLKIKYILNGYNISTEIIADPKSWFEGGGQTGDGVFVKDVCKKLCNIKIKKYPFTTGFMHKFLMPYFFNVKTVKPLNLVQITKEEMISVLNKEYGYEYYGQKHFENLLTKFLEAWWLPKKFGFDIRKSQLSSLILTKQISRKDALEILKTPMISDEDGIALFNEVASKLKISSKEMWDLFYLPKCEIKFKNHSKIYNFGIKLFEILGLEKRIRE